MKRLHEKASQSFPARRRGNKMKSVFGRDMCVDENTSQPTSVRALRVRRSGLHSLEKMPAFLRSVSKFFDTLRRAADMQPSQTVDKVYFFDLCCKSLAEFRRPQTAEEGQIVFSGGVYVGKHTSQATSVRTGNPNKAQRSGFVGEIPGIQDRKSVV